MSAPMEVITPASASAVLQLLPPFPIVLVTTRTNVITINQLAYFTFSPLRLGIAVAHTRHSYGLLVEEREFVINIPHAQLLPAVQMCGCISGKNRNKFQAANLTPMPAAQVQAVALAEAPAHIECAVESTLEFEDRTWFIAKVLIARQLPEHLGTSALLCGRSHYYLPASPLSAR